MDAAVHAQLWEIATPGELFGYRRLQRMLWRETPQVSIKTSNAD